MIDGDVSDDEITEKVIGAAFHVHNQLGVGFLEKVYENALWHELTERGLAAERQKPIAVRYGKIVVGEYFADLVVEDRLLVELKATKSLDDVHTAQVLNYLKATGFKNGLLMNFGSPRVEVRRYRNG